MDTASEQGIELLPHEALKKESYMYTVAVVGLGYVGIPLAVAFGKKGPTIGFDYSKEKISIFKKGLCPADEISTTELKLATHLSFSHELKDLSKADFILVAVPTLVSQMHQPDFDPLITASEMVGKVMKKGAIIIFESTVYPGTTEEICIPSLEKSSGYQWKTDFHVGYSPERVNPGDKEHSLTKIIKIVSGDDDPTLDAIADLYDSITEVGVHRVSSIKVAEAAKVLENTQRDLNIALMNEVAIISNLIGIDTKEVIDAAATKWNFLRLSPGLVGGHCIGVVPYYLSYKAEQLGYHPDVILAGRRINNEMGRYIGQQIIKQMIAAGTNFKGAKVNIFGLSFKPNIQDLSNSKIVDTIRELESFGVTVFVCDPIAKSDDALRRYGILLTDYESLPVADAVVLVVAHEVFIQQGLSLFTSKIHAGACFIDIPSFYSAKEVRELGFSVWRL